MITPFNNDGPRWEGYTLSRLRYERAVTLAHIEMERDRMGEAAARLGRGNAFLSGSIFRRLSSALNYTDYIIMAISLWRKLGPLFKKNSRS